MEGSEPRSESSRALAAELAAEVRARAAARRRSGEVPADLEERLSEHFRRILGSIGTDRSGELRKLREALRQSDPLAWVPAAGSLPGGRLVGLKASLGRAFLRKALSSARLSRPFERLLDLIVEELSEPTHRHRDLWSLADSTVERLAALEQLAQVRSGQGRLLAGRGLLQALGVDWRTFRRQVAGPPPWEGLGLWSGEDKGVVYLLAPADDWRGFLEQQAPGSLRGVVVEDWREREGPADTAELLVLALGRLSPSGKLIIWGDNPRSERTWASGAATLPGGGLPSDPGWCRWLASQLGFSSVELSWWPAGEADSAPAWQLQALRGEST